MQTEGEVAVVGDAQYPLTANAVVARARLIQEVMTKLMKKDTHYGVIPGTQKPTLYKPGAEQLLVTFRIAPDSPVVEDLSTPDNVRYRVTRRGLSNGQIVAAGVGEASSDEEKYKWRRPVCDAEYEAAPEDRKRLKYKRDGSTDKQIRTNPADVANTILKMADKRAFVAMALLATAASDCFVQDLEDLPEEVREAVVEGEAQKREPIKPPTPKAASTEGAVTFVPVDVLKKPTKTGGVRYGVKAPDNEWYGTFDEEQGEFALLAKDEKRPVKITFKTDGQYKNIVTIENA